MREIKFRAWNEGKKEMILHDDLFEFQKQNLSREEFEGVVYLQFVGLKDKNGKPIYEGDILEIEWENTTTRSIVKYHVGYASSGFVFMIGGSGFSECSGIENGKVIGNIYENPELLNKLNN